MFVKLTPGQTTQSYNYEQEADKPTNTDINTKIFYN